MFMYRNTNLLIGKPDWDILVQKTGFTNDAGQCLVMQTMIDERPVDMVFLNSFGSLTRTADARRVRKWMEAQGVPQRRERRSRGHEIGTPVSTLRRVLAPAAAKIASRAMRTLGGLA